MAIVQLDKILSGVSGNLEHIVIYEDIDTDKQLKNYTNGLFAVAVKLEEGNREAKKARLAQVDDVDVLLAHAPELMYDETKKLREFRNATVADKEDVANPGQKYVIRGYRLALGDILTYTADLLPNGVKVGDKLSIDNGKLIIAVEGANVVFEVIEDSGNELDIKEKAFAIQVVQVRA